MMRRHRLRRALALLLFALAGVAASTWPLPAQLSTHLPMTHIVAAIDARQSGWVLAWQSRALVSEPARVAQANIYHPEPNALFYGPTGTGALPIFAPVFLATGDAGLALALTYLLGVALTVWAAALVALLWTDSMGAALVAGVTMLTSHWLMRAVPATAPHCAALFYFPVVAYLAARTTGGAGWAIALGLVIALQASVDLVYFGVAVLAPVCTLAVARLLRPSTRRAGLWLLAAVALALLLLSPLIAGYAGVRAANPLILEQSAWGKPLTLPMHLPWDLFSHGAHAVPPLLLGLIALGALSALLRRGARPALHGAWAHGALWLAVGVALSVTKLAYVGGARVPTPIGVLAWLVPALDVIRSPARVGFGALVGASLLAAAAVAELGRRAREVAGRAWIEPALAAALLVALYATSAPVDPSRGGLPGTIPTMRVPLPWSARALAVLRSGTGPVLELPTAGTPGDEARAMWRSIDHWRPLLNGYASYFPSGYAARRQLIARLPEPGAVAALQHETGVELLAIYLAKLDPAARSVWTAFADAPPAGFRVLHRSRGELLIALPPPAAPRDPAPADS